MIARYSTARDAPDLVGGGQARALAPGRAGGARGLGRARRDARRRRRRDPRPRAARRPRSASRRSSCQTDHDTAAFVDAVAEQLGPEGRWVHYGLTSSDVVDTALSLQIQDAGRSCSWPGSTARWPPWSRQAERHRGSICIGRTHGIHAEPTTFGWKLAGWAFELDRDRARLLRALESNRVGQLSGTVGTYAGLDPDVERVACERLGSSPIRSRPR